MEPEQQKRKFAAILSANAEGTRRLMGEDEAATLQTLKGHRQAMCSLVEKHQGRVVDSPGGNLLAEFASVADAVRCAMEIQEQLRARNEALPQAGRIPCRIGIHLGEVTEEEGKVRGDGVAVAALLEEMAGAGDICISGSAHDQVKGRLNAEYEFMGEHRVRDIAEPVRAYRVLMKPEKTGKVAGWIGLLPHLEKRLDIVKVVVTALSVLVGIVALWNSYFRAGPSPVGVASVQTVALPLPDKPSIAVLPFENMTGDPKQEFFTDGFTEQIITSLSKISSLFVISRNSSFTYKGKPVKLKKVSRELGVRYVLEGSIQKSGDRVRINAQLIDAISDQHLWAEHYDRDMKDIFSLQDEIIFKILTALQVNLTHGEEARVWAKGTKNLEAYLNLIQVREILLQGNVAGNARARQLIEETIALDPKYALAYMYMGTTHLQDFLYNMMALNKTTKSPKESLAQAIEWMQKALAMDDTLAEAHARLGHLYLLSLRHEESIVEVDKAMAMDPNSAAAHYYACIIYRIAGKPAEAIPMCKKAIRLEPFAPGAYYANLGMAFFQNGTDCEEAVKACEKALKLAPEGMMINIWATTVFSECGREKEARKSAKELLRINPKFSVEAYIKRIPQNQKDKDRIAEALRKAGL
jgi:adenylate cyclase